MWYGVQTPPPSSIDRPTAHSFIHTTIQLEYRFRLLDAPAGDYALQATDVETGMAGQSLPFVLSAKRRRRKLYGPIMHV